MLTVTDALQIIQEKVPPLEPEAVPLADALGLVLAAQIVSDVDSPPFDKSMMDGYAVRAADAAGDSAELKVTGEVTAGHVAANPLGPGEAIRIMTGAPIPEAADAVVPVEQTEFDEASQTVHIRGGPVQQNANIVRRGTSLQRGESVLPAGRLLRPQELGALAELGCHEITARRRPRVALLATGDELVQVHETPNAGQIRNSNETMLTAQIRRAGADPLPLGIARDNVTDLEAKISAGLQHDVLLLSGGVSAGKLDLVPSVLEQSGVREVFHKVNLKPGKPIWFGIRQDDTETSPTFVFGLPGNPVSSLVCFEIFVRTAIRRLMGTEPAAPQPIAAKLAEPHIVRGDRPTYHPARLEWTATGPLAAPVRWHGSSDLRATVDANAMILFPAAGEYAPGETIDTFIW